MSSSKSDASRTKVQETISCPNCGSPSVNEPNNTHMVATGFVDKGINFRTGVERRFEHTWFCTKCTRATPYHQLPPKVRQEMERKNNNKVWKVL